MKNVLTWLFTVLLIAPPTYGISSYHIGNSLMNDGLGGSGTGLETMADFYGQDFTLGYHIDSSQAMHSIWDNPTGKNGIDLVRQPYGTWNNALVNYEWDNVLVEPYLSQSANFGTDKQALDNFINYTRTNPANSDTVFHIYQYWPRQSWGNYSVYWAKPSIPDDATLSRPTKAYYENMMNHTHQQYTLNGITVRMIPTGEVFNRLSLLADQFLLPAIGSNPFGTMADYYRDDLHLSGYGRYVAAATIYATLFKTDISEMIPGSNYSFIPQELYTLINNTVWDVVSGEFHTGIADLNTDGSVNGLDLTIWSESYGVDGGGDTDGDGDTDGRDFLNIQRNYRDYNVPASMATVPEPNISVIVVMLGLILLSVERIRTGQATR